MAKRRREHVPTMESAIPQTPIYTHNPLDARHRMARRGRNEDPVSPGQSFVGKTVEMETEHPVAPGKEVVPLGAARALTGSCPRCGRTLIIASRPDRAFQDNFSMLCRPDCDGVWPRITPLGIAIGKPQEKNKEESCQR